MDAEDIAWKTWGGSRLGKVQDCGRSRNGQQISSGPVKIRESNLESSFRLINICGDIFISVEQITGRLPAVSFVGLGSAHPRYTSI